MRRTLCPPWLTIACAYLVGSCGSAAAPPERSDASGAALDAGQARAASASGQTSNAMQPHTGSSGPVLDAGGARALADAAVAPSKAHDAGARMDAAPPMASDADGGVATSDRPGWKLVWSDEFDGPSGSPVDASKWNLVDRGDGFGNSELEYYTPRTANAEQDGQGSLAIHARKESYMGRDYTSARLESSGKFEQTYGRFEARIKLPRGQGIWPAFWLLGANISSVSWPNCGEIDIMENIGKEPSTVHGSMHGPGYSGGNALTASYALPNGQKFADAFHVFALEWEPNVARFYVDDVLYETRTPKDVPANAHWVYDHPFYVLLNVAVGGTWPGSPDASTLFPQTMSVDYVRVYARP